MHHIECVELLCFALGLVFNCHALNLSSSVNVTDLWNDSSISTTPAPTNDPSYCRFGYAYFYTYRYFDTYRDGQCIYAVSNRSLSCQGAYSCEKPSYLASYYAQYCYGDSSCSNNPIGMTITYSSTSAIYDIYCQGTRSCYNTSVMYGDDIHCMSQLSCANSYIFNFDNLYAYGAYSIANSYLDSGGYDHYIDIHIYGYNAGYNTTIYCQSVDTCYIYCYFYGSDCGDHNPTRMNSIYIICAGTCYYYNDDGIDYGIDNIYGYGLDYYSNTRDENEFFFQYDSDYYDDICTENEGSTAYVFDGGDFDSALGYSNYYITAINSGVNTMCCRGYDSCEDVNIRMTISDSLVNSTSYDDNSNITMYAQDKTVICSGYYGCDDMNLTVGTSLSFLDYDLGTIGVSDDNNIICSGYYACTSSNFQGSKLIAFNYSVVGSVNLVCEGAYSCYASVVKQISHVYCGGHYSCLYTEISRVPNVYFYGPYAGVYTSLISDGIGEMNIYFLAANSGSSTTIECTKNDTCNIICPMEYSCVNVEIYCQLAEKCNVDCDNSTSFCPERKQYGTPKSDELAASVTTFWVSVLIFVIINWMLVGVVRLNAPPSD